VQAVALHGDDRSERLFAGEWISRRVSSPRGLGQAAPPVSRWAVDEEDPGSPAALALIARHLAFARANSPPEDVHALEATALQDRDVTFFAIRDGDELVGMGALQQLDAGHGEIKSMHTAETARGRGVGRAMLHHLLAVARARGYRRVSLETGTMAAFAPARALYARAGFVVCEPFAAYGPSPNSVCMTLDLEHPR
jgi:putative acetyltransferase